ncbi:amidohydrolase family protein [Bradyrhizobium sp. WD16]|uniref:amidohydrolase family protein n=1 Tax=Bradyrhizobium sp. WD16 TaxID=1521768 RepID=UPI0020A5BCE9|nr:amidohydrolase family protein [Bradyrhizobium sp. WD16]UTD26928.1 amidohydrolase [Bradyrhizobium sp. WD16]
MKLFERDIAGSACRCCVSRRSLLKGAGAVTATLAATAALPGIASSQSATEQSPAAEKPTPFRIDVHHHLVPPDYVGAIHGKLPPLPAPSANWTLAKSLDDMDTAGVQTAMLSVTTPGLWLGDATSSARLARACNEYAAKLIGDNKGRFGSFAAVPLPAADATLAEIAYALDTLKLDGIAVFTSYEGKWLGDAVFVPVFDELNRRKAVVCVHPTTAACCGNLIPYIPDNVIEFGTDTTRTIASLVFSGAADRWPDIKFIFSHAGGTMPFLIERFEFLARMPQAAKMLPNGVRAPLQRFYYDTAQASNPAAMGALRKLVQPSQIVFGTDFPFRTGAEHVTNLAHCGFGATDLHRIERDNALGLLPRLRV